ncbi:hypothetical protein PISMIDRAFT_690810 [Pisolithus microcarpus 441]|uniref:Unplaced genomic scaffold scaffold_778, whole genome shotgun sequence n=1 Tax=Pisolithus microcarpus 441 TaxID=765257 RepID=A0A0C9Y0G5_9AGAM|nr:hypothetical protein PISMIDRAFT_690815 [Pisolithus microcarpus 441]KIK10714.1 hypothetical protein PISMIDRAFT_690810 [Pisolithus microcarpus 441]
MDIGICARAQGKSCYEVGHDSSVWVVLASGFRRSSGFKLSETFIFRTLRSYSVVQSRLSHHVRGVGPDRTL